MTIEELQVKITAQTQQFEQKINSVQKQIGNLSNKAEKSANKINNSFSKLFKGFSVAAITAGITKIVKDAIEMASSLEEVQNVVEIAFGSMNIEVEKFAQNAIKQFGMSELSAKQIASTFMAMGNGMGIVGENGKNMALNLTALTADMASFYDVSQNVASTALKSIYTGETETLKQFGIVMTEVNLQEFARQQGVTKSIAQMNQAEKTLLRYQYVMQATSYAQGDFARTSGSWANQTRILKEQFKSLLGILGKGLVAALTPLVRMLNTILSGLTSIANAIAKIFGGSQVKSAVSDVDTISGGIGDVSDSISDMDSGLQGATSSAKKLKNQLMGFDELNVMQSQDTGGGTSSGGAASGSIGAGAVDLNFDTTETQADTLTDKIKGVADTIKNYLQPAFERFLDGFNIEKIKNQLIILKTTITEEFNAFTAQIKWDNWQPSIEKLFGSVGSFLGSATFTIVNNITLIIKGIFNAFSAPLATFANSTMPTFLNIVSGFASTLTTIIESIGTIFSTVFKGGVQPILNVTGNILTDFQNIFNDWWSSNGQEIVKQINTSIESISSVLLTLWNTVLEPIVAWLAENVQTLWNEHIGPFVENVLKYSTQIYNDLLTLCNNTLIPLINYIVEALGPIVSKIVKSIGKVVSTVVGGIIDVIGDALQSLSGLIKFVTGVFTGDWNKAWNGIKQFFGGIWDAIRDIVKTTCETIGQVISIAWNDVMSILSTIAQWVYNKVVKPIVDYFKGLWKDINGFFKSLWSDITVLFSGLGNWFYKKVTSPIVYFFKSMGNSIKGIWNDIWKAIKNIINSIIGGINGMIRGVVNGINTVIRAMNKLHFDIPDWVPALGGKSFGFNISPMTVTKIPMLANGGILTKPTLNIAGEAGPEGVFPLSGANADAWMDNLARKIANVLFADNKNTSIYLQVDGKTFGKVAIENINAITRQQSKFALNLI